MNRNEIIKLGLKLGSDARVTTVNAFYFAAAAFLPTETKSLRRESDKLSAAIAAAKLGLPQSQLETLSDRERSAASPSGATIVRFVGLARRFPDADRSVSLEVYGTAAAAQVREAKALNPDGEVDKASADREAVVEVAAAVETMPDGKLSIRDARTIWQNPNATPRAKSDKPENVADRVAWLISQPAAVAEYVADPDNAESVATLVAMLTATK